MTKLTGGQLCNAIRDGDDAAVQAHLDAGGSPDLKNSNGAPALVVAAANKRLGIVRMLIKAGANLELVTEGLVKRFVMGAQVVDTHNDTALTMGAQVGALEVVEALLRAGADPSHKGYEGRTAAEWAQENGHRQVAALLANPQLLREGDARRRGLADEALPAGTRLRVVTYGEGTYERWGKNRIGANNHFVRFASGVEKVQLKKLLTGL